MNVRVGKYRVHRGIDTHAAAQSDHLSMNAVQVVGAERSGQHAVGVPR
jgi:hypothetical protein